MFYFPITKSSIFDIISTIQNLSEAITIRISTLQFTDPNIQSRSTLNSLCHIIINNQQLREAFSNQATITTILTDLSLDTNTVPFLYTLSRDRQITTFSI